MAGWESSTGGGFESTTFGWESGASPSSTRRGQFMGFNAWPTADTCSFHQSKRVRYQAFGVEIPDYLSSPNNTSDAGTLDLTDYIAWLTLTRSYSVDGAPIAAIPKLMGVPREVNPFAGNADAWTSGIWHWYALDGAGRTQMATYAAAFAAELDASLGEMIEIGNESNIPAFNHNGQVASNGLGAGAELVAPMYADMIEAVRAENPTLPIILGSMANRGDIANPADSDETGPGWLSRMILAEPRLLTTARPDFWGYHPYTGAYSPLDGWAVVDGESKTTGGTGWAIPQLIAFRDMLRYFGVTNPDDDPAQVCIMEYGTFWTGPGYSEAMQLQYLQQYISAFDTFRAEGWLAGPEIHYTCYTPGNTPGSDPPYSIYHEEVPHLARPAGTYFDFVAAYDPGAPEVPVPPIEPLDIRVEIGVKPTQDTNPFTFVVGHATRGEVGGTYLVGERFDWIPITGDVVTVDIDRGRDQVTESAEAGTCTVVVRNDRTDRGTAGDYDPWNFLSPLFPSLAPQSRVRVIVDGTPLFTGDISTVDVTDERDDIAVTTINAVDPLARLAKRIRYKPEAEHPAGRRIHRIIERARVIDPEYLAAGVATFQAGTRQRESALDMCNAVALGDGGLFYCNPQGRYVYLDRALLKGAAPVVTFTDNPAGLIRYSSVVRSNGWESLYNSVQISGVDDDEDDEASATNHASIRRYGLRELSFTSPIASRFGRTFRAKELLAEHAYPNAHFHTVTIPTTRYRATDRRSQILGIDIGTTVRVSRSAPNVTPSTVYQDLTVVGVSHRIGGVHDATVTFTFAPKPF